MNIYFDFRLIWCLEDITVYAGGNQLCSYWSEANKPMQPIEATERKLRSMNKDKKLTELINLVIPQQTTQIDVT